MVDEISKGNHNLERRKINIYKRKLRVIKFFILVTILVLFVYISFMLPSSSKKEHKFNFQSKDSISKEQHIDIKKKLPELFQPRFYGEDKKGRPFTIKARFAKQVDEDRIYLRNIIGNLMLSKDEVNIIAENGFLLQEKKIVELSGNVLLTTNDPIYKLQAQRMEIDYNLQKATAWQELSFSGSFGLLTADKLDVDANTNTLTFTKNVKLVLNN